MLTIFRSQYFGIPKRVQDSTYVQKTVFGLGLMLLSKFWHMSDKLNFFNLCFDI
jgi:hypothetical protein